MPRAKSPNLTDAELRLMEVLWTKGPATVAEVHASLASELGLAYSTVLTTMRILEEKGYARHTKEGRAFVYHPVVDRQEASRSAVRHLLARFFGNSRERLVLNLLEDEAVSGKELERIRKLIAEGRK
jgi:predicted transcriptional regulator